ncbi:MAG: DUF882 domain-containing protein [Deltaproteobacteria bacterium]|nr:DUF882 domain-containing protein [Deltaproteobacteria bacterium]
MKTFFFILCLLLLIPFPLNAMDRFFILGSGKIHFSQNGKTLEAQYRQGENYDEKALKKINAVYGSNFENPAERMSLRFLEVLSAIQAHFNNASIYIKSGYRSPNTNQKLREQGKLAAQSSMHKEAAAADFYLEGVSAEALRDYAQGLDCCGVGYYHGRHIHLDTGPKRWWDEKTSGTESKEPQENEKIIAMTQYDLYSPSEKISFDLARVTNFPIQIKSLGIQKIAPANVKQASIFFDLKQFSKKTFSSASELKNIEIKPEKMPTGRYYIEINFSNSSWSKMPATIYSNEFEVR